MLHLVGRHVGYVRVFGVQPVVALVVAFGGPELLERHHLSHDFTIIFLRSIDLGDGGFEGFFLFRRAVENDRAVLRAGVRSLAVQLRGVVRGGEEDVGQLLIADYFGVVVNLHRFGVAGGFFSHLLVGGISLGAAGIAAHHLLHAFYLFKRFFLRPETAAGEGGDDQPT